MYIAIGFCCCYCVIVDFLDNAIVDFICCHYYKNIKLIIETNAHELNPYAAKLFAIITIITIIILII